MKKLIANHIGKSIPFVLGLFIGAGLTRNKYVWLILIIYIFLVFFIKAAAKKMINVKKSVDKKIAIRNAGVESLNSAIEYMDFTFVSIWGAFDKYYPVFIFLIGIACFTGTFIFLWMHEWFWAVVTFTLSILFTVLNQIWKKVKYLEVKKDGSKKYDETSQTNARDVKGIEGSKEAGGDGIMQGMPKKTDY